MKLGSENSQPKNLLDLLIQRFTDWSGMAKLVEAFGNPYAAATVLICAFFVIFAIIVAVAVIAQDGRESARRSREREAKRQRKFDLAMALLAQRERQQEQDRRRRMR